MHPSQRTRLKLARALRRTDRGDRAREFAGRVRVEDERRHRARRPEPRRILPPERAAGARALRHQRHILCVRSSRRISVALPGRARRWTRTRRRYSPGRSAATCERSIDCAAGAADVRARHRCAGHDRERRWAARDVTVVLPKADPGKRNAKPPMAEPTSVTARPIKPGYRIPAGCVLPWRKRATLCARTGSRADHASRLLASDRRSPRQSRRVRWARCG